MEVSIKAINLTKKFGNFTYINHINFEVYKNEIFAFLVPNGENKD